MAVKYTTLLAVINLNGSKPLMPEKFSGFITATQLAVDHLIFQLTFLLTLTCTSICFTRRDVCMHDIFFSVCKMFLRLQITAINEICKPTGTNVFVNLTKLFYTRKTIFCVLEVTCIFCLEIFTNGALSNVLSGNFRPYTCKYKIKKCICR